MTPFVDDTFQAIDEFERMPDPGSIVFRLGSIISRFGFTGFILTGLPEASSIRRAILLNGWPEGWFARYEEAGHYRHDPCARHCRTTTRTFLWAEIPDELKSPPAVRQIFHEAAEFGFREGLCIPLHTIHGFRNISMGGNTIELPPGARRMLHILSVYAAGAAERLVEAGPGRPPPARLTRREREVLTWIALGKTIRDVGEILRLSDHTVGEHLKNVRRKLGTTNAVHSVVEAVRLGEIRM